MAPSAPNDCFLTPCSNFSSEWQEINYFLPIEKNLTINSFSSISVLFLLLFLGLTPFKQHFSCITAVSYPNHAMVEGIFLLKASNLSDHIKTSVIPVCRADRRWGCACACGKSRLSRPAVYIPACQQFTIIPITLGYSLFEIILQNLCCMYQQQQQKQTERRPSFKERVQKKRSLCANKQFN